MSWIKLCETKKSLQTYQAEGLSQANFESRKPNLMNQSASSSQMTMCLIFKKLSDIRVSEV